MVSGIGAARDDCAALIDKYRDRRLADRVFDLAWTHNQVVRRQINASQADAQLYERLAGLVLHAHSALRAEQAVLLQNRRGQRSEEHTSELQSLMRNSYAVFCLKKKTDPILK